MSRNASLLSHFATVAAVKYTVRNVRGVTLCGSGPRPPDGARASRTLPKAAGEDQEIAERYGTVTVKVEPRFVLRVAPAQPELRRELQKVGKSDRPVAIKVGSKGLGCDIRRHIPQ